MLIRQPARSHGHKINCLHDHVLTASGVLTYIVLWSELQEVPLMIFHVNVVDKLITKQLRGIHNIMCSLFQATS